MAMVVMRVLQVLSVLLLLVGFGFPGCLSRPGLYVNLLPVLAGAALSMAALAIEKLSASR